MSRRRASHSEQLSSLSTLNESPAYPFSSSQQQQQQQQHQQPPRRGPIEGPNGRRLIRRVTWRSSTYKLMASLWVLGVFYIVWLIRDLFYLPFTPSDGVSSPKADDFLAHFMGHQECGISSLSLYNHPEVGDEHGFCRTRASLLSAMSNGGRHGFDAAYTSQGCSYRWYTTAQICEVLQKFDGIAFVGDDTMTNVYAGFNLLLRENLASGALKEWDMSPEQREICRCDSQFTSKSCWPQRVTASDQVPAQDDTALTHSPYVCSTSTPHAYLSISGSPTSKSVHEKFHRLTNQGGHKKTLPIIHSLSLATSYSLSTAQTSMDEWQALTKSTGHNAPFLWIGPTALGHQKKPAGSEDLPAVWQYAIDTAEAAHERGMDVLGMYNATLQADSFDGTHYGEKVALMQAMMVINWLDTL
ncbi:uncharacterized protein EURHEDRAFT_375457 [Aspergillus ruber CBS 135680]|uniref:Uncharacterized protein n=1 Tax=Aspergillus ruber (strain CBS 135680) TaxID=1388766 RepID=A0A017SLY7_ASPRC|nr:uncharacterized protein EURHEDRAFT_375457 [Aspergillus ruber CBS 135680]EYE97629.1 hypothetical protein EURHEDRAFT_375457 [Aspergillus ruber CBS 135680]